MDNLINNDVELALAYFMAFELIRANVASGAWRQHTGDQITTYSAIVVFYLFKYANRGRRINTAFLI